MSKSIKSSRSRSRKRGRGRTPKPKVSVERLKQLAQPRLEPDGFVPDKISVYWLDYLIDPTPHKIVDPEQLLEYYEREIARFPRVERLAEPRPWPEYEFDERPKTAHGISIAALKYKPTPRIVALANPVLRDELPPTRLPPVLTILSPSAEKLGWEDDTDTSDLFSIGDFQSRSRYRRKGDLYEIEPNHVAGGHGVGSKNQNALTQKQQHQHPGFDGHARFHSNSNRWGIMRPPNPNALIQARRRPNWR